MAKIKVYGKAQNRIALGIIHAYMVMHPKTTLTCVTISPDCESACINIKAVTNNPPKTTIIIAVNKNPTSFVPYLARRIDKGFYIVSLRYYYSLKKHIINRQASNFEVIK